MTILGGHKPHEKSNQEKKNTKKGKKYEHYSVTNDIAAQLKQVKSIKSYCKIPENHYSNNKSFIANFLNKMNKWLNKEKVEID
tara:strand:+ start:347 stop:595 length:249 start_codon:yes stop_codon:yes gene_type:complete